jgi:hypothetical protein
MAYITRTFIDSYHSHAYTVCGQSLISCQDSAGFRENQEILAVERIYFRKQLLRGKQFTSWENGKHERKCGIFPQYFLAQC